MIPELVQAQIGAPVPMPSLFDVFLQDPSFLVMNLVVLAVLAFVIVVIRRRYAKFFRLQSETFEHRKTTDAQALTQSESTRQMIERQYGVTNAHSQQALAKADEALRISTETLAQITTMNQSIARIAERLDRAGAT